MLDLVRPGLLGGQRAFRDTFARPILRGLFKKAPAVRAALP